MIFSVLAWIFCKMSPKVKCTFSLWNFKCSSKQSSNFFVLSRFVGTKLARAVTQKVRHSQHGHFWAPSPNVTLYHFFSKPSYLLSFTKKWQTMTWNRQKIVSYISFLKYITLFVEKVKCCSSNLYMHSHMYSLTHRQICITTPSW